nr:LacI family DNA-binding transcriptional regulator [uncultured Marinifilum sp.]
MKRTTLKDIAKALNTTIATVSRALHDNPEISTEMKNRVREVANLYDYKPNSTALSLKFQRSYSFGVIFPTLTHYYLTQILSGLLQEATKNGYKLIIAESNYDPDKELELIQEFYELNVDGVLILPSRSLNTKKDKLEQIIRNDVPFLLIDRMVYFDKKTSSFYFI